MRQEPELFIPASERQAPPTAHWRTVLWRLYWTIGFAATLLALYEGIMSMPLGHLKAGIMPAVWTFLGFYVVDRLAAWIFGPPLSADAEQR